MNAPRYVSVSAIPRVIEPVGIVTPLGPWRLHGGTSWQRLVMFDGFIRYQIGPAVAPNG